MRVTVPRAKTQATSRVLADEPAFGREAAGRPADIRVYRADHGWTVADSPVYNYDQDDASWARLLELYSKSL